MKKFIILANGKSPEKKEILPFIRDGYTLVCADGGANSAYRLEIVPSYIIGDFDSIKPKVKRFYKNFSQFIKIKDQSKTDVEKSLDFIIKKGGKRVVLFGLDGDRTDHMLYNFLLLSEYIDKLDMALIKKGEIINFANGDIEFSSVPEERISVFVIKEPLHVKSKGLKYKISGKNIRSISNMALKKRVKLKLKGEGSLVIIRELKE